MVYCHIFLIEESSNLYRVLLPWVEHSYNHLRMGVRNPPEIFQVKMNEIFHKFGFIWECIYDLLIITKGDWYFHLETF